jgi:hypothetical protein
MMEKNVRKEKATNIHFIEYGLLLARDRNIRLTHYYYHVLYYTFDFIYKLLFFYLYLACLLYVSNRMEYLKDKRRSDPAQRRESMDGGTNEEVNNNGLK